MGNSTYNIRIPSGSLLADTASFAFNARDAEDSARSVFSTTSGRATSAAVADTAVRATRATDADNADSADTAITASHALTAKVADIVLNSVGNSTLADTASYVEGGNVDGIVALSTTASYALTTAGTVTNADTASYVAGGNVVGAVALSTTSSYALTSAGTVTNADTASYVAGGNVVGSVTNADTASYFAGTVVGSVTDAVTAETASYANDFTVADDIRFISSTSSLLWGNSENPNLQLLGFTSSATDTSLQIGANTGSVILRSISSSLSSSLEVTPNGTSISAKLDTGNALNLGWNGAAIGESGGPVVRFHSDLRGVATEEESMDAYITKFEPGGNFVIGNHDATGDIILRQDSGSNAVNALSVKPDGRIWIGSGSFDNNISASLQISVPADGLNSLYVDGNSVMSGSLSMLAGNIDFNTVGDVFNPSDYRLKENVSPITSSIDRVKLLNPVSFNYIDISDKQEGFIAHELAEAIPLAVFGEKDAVDNDGNIISQKVTYSKVIPLLSGALKEAIAKIEDLTSRIEDLESRL